MKTTCLFAALVTVALVVPSGSVRPQFSSPGGSATPMPKGCYAKWPAERPVPPEILDNPGLVGIQLVNLWYKIDPGPGHLNWTELDKRLHEIKTWNAKHHRHLKVVLEITNSIRYMPPWLTEKVREETSGREVVSMVNANTGKAETGPLFWNRTYHGRRLQMIREAGKRYAADPDIVAAHFGFANWTYCEMSIPHHEDNPRAKVQPGHQPLHHVSQWKAVGYSTDKMFQVSREIIDEIARSFPHQAINLSFHQTSPLLDGTLTGLAEKVMTYVYGQSYGNRINAQIDFLSATSEPAGMLAQLNPPPNPNQLRYVMKLLLAHSPQIGFELSTSASTYKEDHCALYGKSPCPPPDEVLKMVVDIGLSYRPTYLTIIGRDNRVPELRNVIAYATRQMQQ
jgi:hypothetical protein